MNSNSPSVLPPYIAVVDDDPAVGRALKRMLKTLKLDVQVFTSSESFLQVMEARTPEALILDVQMPGISGLDLQQMIGARGSRLPIIFVSASDDPAITRQAVENGATAFLTKPFEKAELLNATARACGMPVPGGTLRLRVGTGDREATHTRVTFHEADEFERFGLRLAPCPFCRDQPQLDKVRCTDRRGEVGYRARVVCPRCEATIYSDPNLGAMDWASAADDATQRWNQRHGVGG